MHQCLLVHYANFLPLLLECDASPFGLDAVLSHRFHDGTEMLQCQCFKMCASCGEGLFPDRSGGSGIGSWHEEIPSVPLVEKF